MLANQEKGFSHLDRMRECSGASQAETRNRLEAVTSGAGIKSRKSSQKKALAEGWLKEVWIVTGETRVEGDNSRQAALKYEAASVELGKVQMVWNVLRIGTKTWKRN